MCRFPIPARVLGAATLLSLPLMLFAPAQQPAESADSRDVPRARPVDPEILREKDIPRALPVETDDPTASSRPARPATRAELEEIERLRRERNARNEVEQDEALRSKQERALEPDASTEGAPAPAGSPDVTDAGEEIPRALPLSTLPGEPASPGSDERQSLSPLEVAAQRAPEPPERPRAEEPKIAASWETRRDARSFNMRIPAPRGQIVDRWGQPLAQTRVGQVLAVKLPYLKDQDTSSAEVLRFARARINLANRILGQEWALSDDEILTHFENRRWLPLMFSSVLTQWQEETIAPKLDKGLVMFPTYVRHYPEGKLASHILGYIGRLRPLPTRAVASGDELFPEIEGRDGLEVSFDAELQGRAGIANYLFDSDGTELQREITRPAVPGATIVTTLDLEMQRLAEEILKDNVKRGAFVVMHVETGEIHAMASFPSFDPNSFSPTISQAEYDALQNDPDLPLFARAFRAAYPPASTFKLVTALAALESGAITEETYLPCPKVMYIDSRAFHNWAKTSEADMNVVVAIARSCNPFFYRAGLRTGAEHLSSMGHRLGFGQKTGIPLVGEMAGYMPTDSSERERYGHPLAGGYLANTSIGQGNVSATPLQVCQMMAAIANGRAVPEARLVKQVQTPENEVIRHFPPLDKNLLNVSDASLDVVRRGMVKVVNASWGTGKSASNPYVTVCGKTGTGQWGSTSEKRYLAWFAGYVPYERPEFAFAVLYEGDPGETVGGGRIAAPLAGKFFKEVYQKKKDAGELDDYEKSSVNSSEGRGTWSSTTDDSPAPTALPAEPAPQQPAESEEKKRRGFFNRFGRGR